MAERGQNQREKLILGKLKRLRGTYLTTQMSVQRKRQIFDILDTEKQLWETTKAKQPRTNGDGHREGIRWLIPETSSSTYLGPPLSLSSSQAQSWKQKSWDIQDRCSCFIRSKKTRGEIKGGGDLGKEHRQPQNLGNYITKQNKIC